MQSTMIIIIGILMGQKSELIFYGTVPVLFYEYVLCIANNTLLNHGTRSICLGLIICTVKIPGIHQHVVGHKYPLLNDMCV